MSLIHSHYNSDFLFFPLPFILPSLVVFFTRLFPIRACRSVLACLSNRQGRTADGSMDTTLVVSESVTIEARSISNGNGNGYGLNGNGSGSVDTSPNNTPSTSDGASSNEDTFDENLSSRNGNCVNSNEVVIHHDNLCEVCLQYHNEKDGKRFPDGSVRLRNPNIELMDQDILYHLALGSESHDLVSMFGDIKFVCMGGTPKRVEQFAYFIMEEIGHKLPAGTTLLDISQYSYRYSMYKVGPVLSISHGMGIPSVGILLHEVIKLMYHARVRDPVFFRIGTCGGIGLEGGTVVISEEAVDGMLQPSLELPVLGKLVKRPAKLDKKLIRELRALSEPEDPYDTVTGKTMCTYDFYEGQGRLDGAFCEFTETDKMDYLNSVHKAGVVNIEMESLSFAALTHHAGIRSAVICVALMDRLKGDQVLAPKEVLDEWQQRPQKLVSRYIKRYLTMKGRLSLDGHCGSMCVKSPRRFKLVQQESETYD